MFSMKAFLRAFLICFITVSAVKGAVDTLGVVVMDGQILDNRELEREIKRYRSSVLKDYAYQLQTISVADFWDTEYEGVTPKKKLEDKALQALKRLKVQEKMLKQKGLWPYETYQDLLTERPVNNERRKMAVQKSEIIYGPVEFTEQSFFDYQFSNAVIKLKQLMEGKEIPISKALLVAHFEKMKKDVFIAQAYTFQQVEKRVKTHYLEQSYERFVDSLSQQSEINKQ